MFSPHQKNHRTGKVQVHADIKPAPHGEEASKQASGRFALEKYLFIERASYRTLFY